MNRPAPLYAAQTRLDTPLGPLTAAATAQGLAGLWFDAQRHHPGVLTAPHDDAHPWLLQTRRELAAYWRGELGAFSVALDPHGTPFQRAVWAALQTLAAGQTCSYAELAARLGKPKAVRAVGAAIGRNPVSIIVPCHRVIGHQGSLTGYAGGLDRKRALLQLESARPQ